MIRSTQNASVLKPAVVSLNINSKETSALEKTGSPRKLKTDTKPKAVAKSQRE